MAYYKMALKNQKGITLIEMIVFIIVAAVVMPVIISPVLTLLKDSTKPEKAVTANFLGQQKFEEITKNDYSDSGLDITTTTDEFIAYSVVDATDFPDYQWCWKVNYVSQALIDSGAIPTDYKKITVKVKDSYNTEYIYYTLATKRANDP